MKLPGISQGSRRRYLLWLVLNGSAQAAMVIAMALMMRTAFDQFIAPGSAAEVGTTLHYLAGFSLIIIANAGLRWRERVDAERLGQDYIFELRQQLFGHLTRLSPRALQRRSQGGTMLRFVGDLTALRQWISLGIARLTVASITTITTLFALAVIKPVLAGLIAVLLLVAATAMLVLGRALENAARNARRQRTRLAANVSEKISAVAVVQAFNQRQRECRQLRKQSRNLFNAMLHRANRVGQLRAVTEALIGFASAGIILLGAWQISTGQATAGTVIAAMLVVSMLAPALRDLGRVHEYWRSARVSREKILQFLAARGRVWQQRGAPALKVSSGVIEFQNICVDDSIRNFSQRAEGGQRIALVGPNGAGKSTLLALAARLFDPDEGRILIDGQDIAKCSLHSLRVNIGMAGPDLPLLRGSVERNLKYRLPQASKQQLDEVYRQCGIDEMILDLPQGLRTRITDGGRNLSAGQCARISLARALLGLPSILLLDEADANLDKDAASLIEQLLQDYAGTILMVSHRHPRLNQMDQVWQLNKPETPEGEVASQSDYTSRYDSRLTLVQ
jgi:ABC-type multidrug transport system fused ATPase/permease subunit